MNITWEADNDRPGDTISIYEIIGKGGYSVVRRGVIESSGEVVAVKLMENYPIRDSTLAELKLSEIPSQYIVPVRLMLFKKKRRTRHEKIHFADIPPPYVTAYVYPYINGPMLKDVRLKSKVEIHELARHLLMGLKDIHAAGLVHRDIKPANVMLDNGDVKYIDYGFTRMATDELKRAGTPNYMSYECITQDKFTARDWFNNDIFAVGMTIMAMMSRSLPWQYLGDTETIKQKLKSTTASRADTFLHKMITFSLGTRNSVYLPLIYGLTRSRGKLSIDEAIDMLGKISEEV